MTVLVCDNIKNPEEENYTFVSMVKISSISKKYFEWVGTVTNPKYEHNYQFGRIGYVENKDKIKSKITE